MDLVLATGAILAAVIHGAVALAGNPVERENALPGTPAWAIADALADQVEAYASEADVLPGELVHFHIPSAA